MHSGTRVVVEKKGEKEAGKEGRKAQKDSA
jgi:hypothetical protein